MRGSLGFILSLFQFWKFHSQKLWNLSSNQLTLKAPIRVFSHRDIRGILKTVEIEKKKKS